MKPPRRPPTPKMPELEAASLRGLGSRVWAYGLGVIRGVFGCTACTGLAIYFLLVSKFCSDGVAVNCRRHADRWLLRVDSKRNGRSRIDLRVKHQELSKGSFSFFPPREQRKSCVA